MKTVPLAAALLLCVQLAQADAPIVLDANGVRLGFWAGVAAPTLWRVISPTGYTFAVHPRSGENRGAGHHQGISIPQRLYYESNNCTGQAYFISPDAGIEGFTGAFIVRFGTGLWYGPKNATSSERTLLSSNQPGTPCTPESMQIHGLTAFPNNPAETGVSNPALAFPAPLTIGLLDQWDQLLKDGFEGSAV